MPRRYLPTKPKGIPYDETWVAQRISCCPNTGCWFFEGRLSSAGYGLITARRKTVPAHRFVFQLLRGKIPEGAVLDHLCRVPFCVNPDHLEPVSHLENVRRGLGAATARARQKAKTHCKYGHPFSGDNLLLVKNGFRICKTCRSSRSQKWANHNREVINDKARLYRAEHSDKISAERKVSYYADPNKYRERRRAYYNRKKALSAGVNA